MTVWDEIPVVGATSIFTYGHAIHQSNFHHGFQQYGPIQPSPFTVPMNQFPSTTRQTGFAVPTFPTSFHTRPNVYPGTYTQNPFHQNYQMVNPTHTDVVAIS